MDNFLIDECLTTDLVGEAMRDGLAARHVLFMGKSGFPDWSLRDLALEQDYVFVTNNRRDFLKLYMDCEVHSGLIVLVDQVNMALQKRLFAIVLEFIRQLPEDPVNLLIEIEKSGRFHIRQWCAAVHDVGHISSPAWKRQSLAE